MSDDRQYLSDTQRKRDTIRRRNTREQHRTIADLSDALYVLWDEVDENRLRTEARFGEGDREMTGLALEIREFRRSYNDENLENSRMLREMLRGLNDLNQRVAAGNFVANAVRTGREIDSKTPGKNSELKLPGGASWKAPTSAMVFVLIAFVLLGGVIAGVSYVAAAWGPPKHQSSGSR